MKRKYSRQPVLSEINITPFTDVILVLLIIFMIATPLISQNSIEVKLPQASSKDQVEEPKQAYITISSEGIIYYENKILTTKELKQKMTALVGKSADTKVIVAADKACRFQEVVRVIDALKESGVKSLNIATKANP